MIKHELDSVEIQGQNLLPLLLTNNDLLFLCIIHLCIHLLCLHLLCKFMFSVLLTQFTLVLMNIFLRVSVLDRSRIVTESKQPVT